MKWDTKPGQRFSEKLSQEIDRLAVSLPNTIDLSTLPGYHQEEVVTETAEKTPATGLGRFFGKTKMVTRKTVQYEHYARGTGCPWTVSDPDPITQIRFWIIEIRDQSVWAIEAKTDKGDYKTEIHLGDLSETVISASILALPGDWHEAEWSYGDGGYRPAATVFLSEAIAALEAKLVEVKALAPAPVARTCSRCEGTGELCPGCGLSGTYCEAVSEKCWGAGNREHGTPCPDCRK